MNEAIKLGEIGRGGDPNEAARREAANDEPMRAAPLEAWRRPTGADSRDEAAAEAALAKAEEEQEAAAIVEANRVLERGAAAESAVRVVMTQLDLMNPTRISVWTLREIARLLDALYANPEGAIQLGGQVLGEGFSAPPEARDQRVMRALLGLASDVAAIKRKALEPPAHTITHDLSGDHPITSGKTDRT